MAYWLIKSEPNEYAWETLERDGKTLWTGVRNFQARNHLKEMRVGDLVFFYHSGTDRMIMGLARVTSEAEPDPTAERGDWVAVGLVAVKPFVRTVSLEEIRNTHGLGVMPVVSQPRLSVHPVSDDQAKMLLKIAKTEA